MSYACSHEGKLFNYFFQMNCSHSVFDPYPTHTLWRVETRFTQCQVKIKTHQKQNNSGLPGLRREVWFSLTAGWYHSDLCTEQTLGRWNLRIILSASTGTQWAPLGLNTSDQKNMTHLCLIHVPHNSEQLLCGFGQPARAPFFLGIQKALTGFFWKNPSPLASLHST